MSDQNPPQPPPGQYPPQGGYPQGAYPPGPPLYQQPKKSKTVWIVLGVIGVVIILFCGGCLAVGGLFANEVDKAVKEEEKNDTPTAITEGAAFTHDGYGVAAGWVVKKDTLGDVTIEKATVTNNGDEGRRSALLDFTFTQGSSVLATVTCSSQELNEGESSKLDCFSADDFPDGYDTIKVADSF